MKTQKGWTTKAKVLLFLAMFALLHMLVFPDEAGKLAGTPGKAAAQGRNAQGDDALNLPRFRVRSNTFQNNTVMPSTMVFNGTLGSVCTGGNTSPDLEWTPSLPWTKSYAVVVYDETGEFTHWGVYNIPANVTNLPSGAGSLVNGAPVIPFPQISNDTFTVGYVGPCPPATVEPLTHKYLFTVYALDTTFDLPQFNGFLAPSETLFRAMIGHVIESTTITALLSCENMGSACS